MVNRKHVSDHISHHVALEEAGKHSPPRNRGGERETFLSEYRVRCFFGREMCRSSSTACKFVFAGVCAQNTSKRHLLVVFLCGHCKGFPG